MRLFRETHGRRRLPDAFVTAHDLSPQQHLLMQAALQHYVDASISKTVNCPEAMASRISRRSTSTLTGWASKAARLTGRTR